MIKVSKGESAQMKKKGLTLRGAVIISFAVHAIILFSPSSDKTLSRQIILESKKSDITFINFSEKMDRWDIVKPLRDKDRRKGNFPLLFKKKKKSEKQTIDKPASESLSREETAVKESYEKDILKKIHRMKYYPLYAKRMGMEGHVTIRFTLDRSGKIIDYPMIIKGSSHDVLNRAGVLTVTQAAPFPPFPREAAALRDVMTFIVTIDYTLRVN
jgi:TonB family protein